MQVPRKAPLCCAEMPSGWAPGNLPTGSRRPQPTLSPICCFIFGPSTTTTCIYCHNGQITIPYPAALCHLKGKKNHYGSLSIPYNGQGIAHHSAPPGLRALSGPLHTSLVIKNVSSPAGLTHTLFLMGCFVARFFMFDKFLYSWLFSLDSPANKPGVKEERRSSKSPKAVWGWIEAMLEAGIQAWIRG